MNDPHTQDTNSQAVASELNLLFEQALAQQRTLWEKTVRFSRDESLRFTTLWLKHTNLALENVQGQDGFKSLIQVQQDWLRDMMQDYTAQSVRFNETMSRLTAAAMSRAMNASRDAMKEGQDVVRQTGETAGENLDTMVRAGAELMQTNTRAIDAGVEQAQPAAQDFQPSQEYH